MHFHGFPSRSSGDFNAVSSPCHPAGRSGTRPLASFLFLTARPGRGTIFFLLGFATECLVPVGGVLGRCSNTQNCHSFSPHALAIKSLQCLVNASLKDGQGTWQRGLFISTSCTGSGWDGPHRSPAVPAAAVDRSGNSLRTSGRTRPLQRPSRGWQSGPGTSGRGW